MNDQNSISPDRLEAGERHIEELPGLWAAGNTLDLTIMRCAGMLYGLEIQWVREIRPFSGAAPVYGLPAFWVGITALRGQLYSVLDMQKFLFPQQILAENGRQVVFTAVDNLLVGLLVAEVPGVRQIDAQFVTAVSTPETPYVSGITPDQVTILDLPALFADPRLIALASRADEAEI
jgi:purine-binding chemotaxis protein CheW